MLAGVLEPDAGAVEVFGHAVALWGRAALHRVISYVPQQGFLLPGSVADNIACGARDVASCTQADIEVAAKCAEADEFIRGLSDGYDTVLGSGGVTLSGGQRQRTCLARGCLSHARVMLLDESLSAVDSDREERVLRNLLSDRQLTVICTTHRSSLWRGFDRIVVMHNGRVCDVGSHRELLERCEVYNALWLGEKVVDPCD